MRDERCVTCSLYAGELAKAQDRGNQAEIDHILAQWREHDIRVGHITP